MTLLCQVQAPGHAAEGEHLKLFKDADADIGNLLAAAPPQGPTVPRGHDHTNSGPITVHPFGLQPWSMAGPGPSFPHASTAALHTSMMSDEARLGSSSLFMPSNHLIVPNSLPAQNAVDVAGPEGGQAAIGIPWIPEGPGNAHVAATGGDNAEAYQDMSTSQLLEVYEQQQEELVKLSKELEDYTRKNIQLSMRNLEHLQQLQSTNSPIMSHAIVQPPLLSQLATRVRQQAQEPLGALGDRPGDGGAAAAPAGAAGDGDEAAPRPLSRGSTDEGSREAVPEEVRLQRPRGVVTQEQAAAILMQMSQRMADPGAARPP